MAIHPTAVIDRQAEVDTTVQIGPYVVVEGPVRIGAGTNIRAHAYLSGWTQIGENCEIHPFAVVGHFPQDFHYSGERSYCRIGNRVVIREGATVHRGTQPESATVIGDECLLMAYSHIGHNCELGKGAKVYNNALLAGHVEVGDNAIVSGACLVHQFTRIGKLAFIAGGARIGMDVPPFFMAYGESTVVQHNIVGMRRAGYCPADIREIRQAFRTLYRSGRLFRAAVTELAGTVRTQAGRELLAFLQAESRRGFCAAGKSSRSRLRSDGSSDSDALAGE
ncbi:MAG TPA: acyl-ACP--UDP-N-acetylglucosamine O-acyltransferase [Phycisphaerae bacterium]|nr:acyl-ACP--UDP-N-acetylglucosamine O-acyltransferase [Phycisphaerae bacterium]HOJ74957.1 acyl-ACP--UDP-N-acetylglucosamine O-acyltransferase [Phycisphaerae bacterium]HOM51518.1 acyl-ACP--UDP-N-acetylglucosamine O-acyltransferase [Phycisphaerae bacterium]HON66705.1 acyl-ACP--UDP-N-acetylglucosamine O-acyltransferase [Phycisphaerae bacterium]HOQ87688.1 acyl-ACP--UDP-N-acetylglucosamine O-acyltransferase [Phycisphaerae bacterium]